MELYPYTLEELRASVEEGTRQVENGQYLTDSITDALEREEMENYLYERAEKRFMEMKAGRYIANDSAMAFIRDYSRQSQPVAV